MLDSIDTMVSLGIIFLVLSMVLKYVMSLLKRFLKTKANVAAREMKIFIGENTSQFLKLYAKKQKHLNLLHKTKIIKKKTGFRLLNKEELKEITLELKRFLEGKNNDAIKKSLGMDEDSNLIDKLEVVKEHLDALQNKADTIFDNTLRKINEEYKKKIQLWTFICAFLIAAFMNASFFDIYENISTNSEIKAQLVSNTTSIINEMEKMEKQISEFDKEKSKNIQEEFIKTNKELISITEMLPKKKQLFGWEDDEFCKTMGFNKLIGFLISALLISFGAPFWHDYLKSFINIRKTIAETSRQNSTATTESST